MSTDPTRSTATRFTPSGHFRVPLPGRRVLLVHRRTTALCAVVLVLTTACAGVTLLTGTYDISAGQALRTLAGAGSDLDRFIVVEQRLPRVVAAVLVGAASAASGAIFQSTSRNPLGSPDIIGFTTGAATGGIAVILLTGSSGAGAVALGALAGGTLTALAVVLLSAGRALTGDRLVLSGIALAAMLAAVNDYLLSRAPLEQAEAARAWQFGSLNTITWAPVVPLAAVLLVALPLAVVCARGLRVLELGDDVAAGVGLRLARTRGAAMALGVALVALAVATAGPIGFVALVAPQLVRRLARTPGISVLASAAVGALLLVVADLGAQRLLAPFQIPVGLVTAALGGAYLVWLVLAQDGRAQRALGRPGG